MYTENRLAYLAGLFDGEGCISASDSTLRPQLSLNMCDFAAVATFGQFFGLSPRSRVQVGRNCKPQYRLQAVGAKAVKILTLMLPFLITKHRQAQIAIELVKNTDAHRHMDDIELNRRCALIGELRTLNRRGK